jgi:uncharacterized protein (DUF1778 family)
MCRTIALVADSFSHLREDDVMSPTTTTASERRSRGSARRERLEARITPELKVVLERAAALQGRSLTAFVVDSAAAAAEETIRRHEVMTLSAQDGEAFVRALLNPPEPNEYLRAAARRHGDLLGE